jgi:hypothetical protein
MQRMEQQRAPSIVTIATKYGLIQGVLWFVVSVVRAMVNIQQNWVPTLIDAAIVIVLVVLAHGEFKKSHAGKMTYPQGLGSGTLLSSIAAVLAAILEYVYVKYINTGYLVAQIQAQRAALAQRGITGAQAQQAMSIMGAVMTPVGVVVVSLISGVILGFVVALIVSMFTQKDPMAI